MLNYFFRRPTPVDPHLAAAVSALTVNDRAARAIYRAAVQSLANGEAVDDEQALAHAVERLQIPAGQLESDTATARDVNRQLEELGDQTAQSALLLKRIAEAKDRFAAASEVLETARRELTAATHAQSHYSQFKTQVARTMNSRRDLFEGQE